METKSIVLIAICFLTISCHPSKKVVDIKKINSAPNYFKIINEKEEYFKQNNKNLPDSVVFNEGSPYMDFLKWKHFWRLRVDSLGSFEPYLKYLNEHFNTLSSGKLRTEGGTWRELGYISTPIARSSLPAGGGPIEFINFFGSNRVLAGSTAGGLFESRDWGNSWQNIGSDTRWKASGCTWADYDKTDPNRIYAISTNGHSIPNWIGFAGGMMRTTNGGATWDLIGNYAHYNNNVFNKLVKFLINPSDPNTIFLASCDGLYKTSNARANPASSVSWTRLNFSGYIYDMEYMPNSNRLIVTAAVSGNNQNDNCSNFDNNPASYHWNIFYTDDNGSNWHTVNGTNKPSLNNLKAMTIETTDANSNLLYIQLISTSNIAKLHKYDFSSNTWYEKSEIGYVSMGGGHGFGVSDQNEDKVAVACCGGNGNQFRISSNGGTTWNYPALNSSEYHDDIEDIVFHPQNDAFYIADHGGIHVSTDNGIHWQGKNTNLGVATVTAMAISEKTPGLMTAGLYHGGTIRTFQSPYYPGWIPNWQTIWRGDGGTTLLDEPYSYATDQYNLLRTNNIEANAIFCNKNFNITQNLNGINHILSTPSFGLLNPIFNSKDKSCLYMNGQRSVGNQQIGFDVMRSKNRGDTWEPISNFSQQTPSSYSSYITWKIISAPSNENILYAYVEFAPGTGSDPNRFRIFKTTNANDNSSNVVWTDIYKTPHALSDVKVDPYAPDILYLSVGNNFNFDNTIVLKLFSDRTVNRTVNLDPNYSLGTLNTTALAIEKGSNGGIYLATDAGVYYRSNVQENWTLFGTGLPHTTKSAIDIDYNTGKLRVATFGRGIWETNLRCPNEFNLTETGIYNTDTYIETINNITSNARIPGNKKVTYRAGNEVILHNEFHSSLGSEFHIIIYPCRD